MSEEQILEDQSHYEISLTAGQAFVAFVLLLLSLAASFAFGLLIGKGQSEDRLVVKKEPAVINEGSVMAGKKLDAGKIVELGVDDFKPKTDTTSTTIPAATTSAPPVQITETTAPATPLTTTAAAPTTTSPAPAPVPAPVSSSPAPKPQHTAPATPAANAQPVYAQLLVSTDQKTAENLAATLIDKGFPTAYVERAAGQFKVRVKFNSEADARAAEAKLKEFAKDVWIVK